MNKYERMFNPDGLKVPRTLSARNLLRVPKQIVTPKEMFFDCYTTRIEQQGDKPWCAAYSATSFAENILWRKRGYPEQIDPASVYRIAKTIDGEPKSDGTTLEAALRALLQLRYFDGMICQIKVVGGNFYGTDPDAAIADLKAALHRYGGCIIGCRIDESWFNPVRGVIKGGGKSLGGHAVQLAGADEKGVLIVNSWGAAWGHGGKAYIPNSVFRKQLIYGAVLTRCLDGME